MLYDKETESIWYHLRGENALTCFSGEFADRKLPEFESTTLRWASWKEAHPETKFLKPADLNAAELLIPSPE